MFATADGRNHFGPDGGEDGLQRLKKGGVRSIVGPQAADPSGVGLRGEGLPSFGPAECGVARVEQVARGVVDVEERGMEFRSWRSGVESDLRRTGQSEGVTVTKRTRGAQVGSDMNLTKAQSSRRGNSRSFLNRR